MSRKTVSVSVSAKMDDLLAALAARYGSTKSGILNLILQRTLSADDGLKKLMSVELKQKDEKIAALEQEKKTILDSFVARTEAAPENRSQDSGAPEAGTAE